MSIIRKIASAVGSLASSAAPTPAPGTPAPGTPAPGTPARASPAPHVPTHDEEHEARAKEYAQLASRLDAAGVPVSFADCASCAEPCPSDINGQGGAPTGAGTVAAIGNAWDGKTYDEYILEKYGELGALPDTVDTDWESDLPGSGGPPVGRVVVISTGKSNWVRDHTDEKDSLAYQLNNYMSTLGGGKSKGKDADPAVVSSYVLPSAFPTPSTPLSAPVSALPSLYSSSMVSQSDDPTDQMCLVFPDWKAVLEVENSPEGAKALYDDALAGTLGRAGRTLQNNGEGVQRKRSWVLPYRAIVLLCSHKTRDKRCHIASGVLRPALITCLEKNGIAVDETGHSLACLERPALEEIEGTDAEREAEVGRRIEAIEGVHGGSGGEVGVFNINHLGGHRYAGVMLILFPSGAYLSYGRVTPHEIPRVVEETILQGKVVPGLLRSGTGLARPGAAAKQCGFLGW